MLQPGTIVDKYEIVAPIAAGGMGVVYRARHAHLRQEVALKLLSAHLALNERTRTRFAQEAYVQAQLAHPHIVAVRDFFDQDGTLGIVMSLVEGPSLEDVMAAELPGSWSLPDIRHAMLPVIEAVTYAHARGVVHRDLKPANVMLDRAAASSGLGVPVVTDFGLAKVLTSTAGLTRAGTQMGTLPYMSPEQFAGKDDIDARSDVFALGMMFWRLLAGELPLNPNSMADCAAFYSGAQPLPDLRERRPGLDPALEAEVLRALSVPVQQRHEHARVLYDAVSQLLERPEPAAPKAKRTSAPPAPAASVSPTPTPPVETEQSAIDEPVARSSHRAVWLALGGVAALAVLLVTLLSVGAVGFWATHEEGSPSDATATSPMMPYEPPSVTSLEPEPEPEPEPPPVPSGPGTTDPRTGLIRGPVWVICAGATKSESGARQTAAKLRTKGLDADVLWIPDYGSLSGAKSWLIWVGPVDYGDRPAADALVAKVSTVVKDAYGLKLDASGPREKL